MEKAEKFYFNEPRLNFTFFGRFAVRLVIYVVYGFLAAAALSLLIFFSQERTGLFWVGVFLGLFLIDRLLHFGEAEYSLDEVSGERRNLAQFLSPASYNVLESAYERAALVGGDFNLHLLKGLLSMKNIQEAFVRLELKKDEFRQKFEDYLEKSEKSRLKRPEVLKTVANLTGMAYEEAKSVEERFIEPRNLLVAAVIGDKKLADLFELFSIKPADLREALIFSRHQRSFASLARLPATLGGFAHQSRKRRGRIMNRAWTARITPTLDRYSMDLTALARMEQVGFLIGHQEEYKQLVDVLSRPAKPNVLLVGPAGVGKNTLIGHLAFRIIKDEVPAALFDRRLVMLELGSLVASAPPDELAGRMKKIIDEIITAGNVILYIPDIDNLVKTSGSGFMSAADILLPEIEGGSFPVIGATYPREYKQLIEPQSDFAGSFEAVRVEEVSEQDTVRLLVFSSLILEKQFNVFITFGAVRQAAALAKKFFRNKPLPSSAENLLKEALIEADTRKQKVVDGDLVVFVAERRTKIPIHQARAEEAEKLLNLEKFIHQRMINQEEAVKSVSEALREYRSGLSRRGGPIATFLFVGPTGVGKTELSKILAKTQFGSEDLLVRFDMSEYQDKQSIFRFIGSPDGQMAGMMTEAIKSRPYSLVLLDEFEKAHPDILNLFLQVFDDGRLTDNFGQTVDFQNTIIIATSNAHSNYIKEEVEKGTTIKQISEEIKKKLTEYFRPELLNRFSEIIVFRNLTLPEIALVAKIQLNDLSKMLEETQGIDLKFSSEVISRVAEMGYDPVFGARPLRKVISENIRSVLAEKVLRKEIGRGNVINVTLDAQRNFEFKVED